MSLVLQLPGRVFGPAADPFVDLAGVGEIRDAAQQVADFAVVQEQANVPGQALQRQLGQLSSSLTKTSPGPIAITPWPELSGA
jgi:hypothetical protein